MKVKPIRKKADYESALHRVEALWGSPKNSKRGEELDVLLTLVEAYEREHYPIHAPNPIEAIKFRLEQGGLDPRILIGILGQRSRVSEVMNGTRSLSLNMIRRLHAKLGIPLESLIRPLRRRTERAPVRPWFSMRRLFRKPA